MIQSARIESELITVRYIQETVLYITTGPPTAESQPTWATGYIFGHLTNTM